MAVSQLAYVGVGVSDMAAWEVFAAEVMGLMIGERADDGTVYLRMDEYHHRIILHPTGEDDILYVGLQAPTLAEYEESKAALKAAGIAVTQGTDQEKQVRRLVDFVKFESGGLNFELSVGPGISFHEPFRPGRPHQGFKTGELGFGHIVLRSTDQQATVKLLTETLGFRISDYVGVMVFLHCNPRHHTIAIQPANPNIPVAANKKMWHFMLETNSLDDVGICFDLAQKRGFPPASDIGKHMNDHMVSIYLTTPSGFEIEYGWGGRLIDDSTWQVVRHTGGDIWGHHSLRQQAAVQPAAAAAR